VPDAPLSADLDHVAVAVERWDDAFPRYLGDLGGLWMAGGRAFGFAPGQIRFPHPERAMKVELLEPNAVEHNDFLRRFLDSSGPGPHHLTFKVPDLAGALDVVADRGYDPIGVDLSFDDWKESFIHPKQACGIVVQIAQAAGEMPTDVPAPTVVSRVARPAALTEVALLVPDLTVAGDLFEGLLGGTRSSVGDDHVVLDWPGGGRLRIARPPAGSDAAAWLGSRPGRLGHVVFEVDDPAVVRDAEANGDGSYTVPATANHGVRLELRHRA
jgi:catechol 2,3-dioxygenase-like lactoylglutathione lyase family enzyme